MNDESVQLQPVIPPDLVLFCLRLWHGSPSAPYKFDDGDD